jgi:hypothetical protein
MPHIQKFIELANYNNKNITIDTSENIGLIFDEKLNLNGDSCSEKSGSSSLKSSDANTVKLADFTNRTKAPSNQSAIELPKVNIETLHDYPICYSNYKLPVNYIKYAYILFHGVS